MREKIPAAMTFAKRHAWWLAPFLGGAGFVSYYLVIASFPAFRDSALLNLVLVTIAVALALVGLCCAWKVASWKGRLLHLCGTVVSCFCAGVLFWYVFDLSYQMPEESATTSALKTAPAFTLTSAEGKTVDLGSYRGKKVVLSFYRGFW